MKLITFLLLSAAIPATAGKASTTISAGSGYVFRIAPDGTVWAWGWNSSGILGDGTTTDRPLPVQVPGLTDVVAVDAHWSFGSLALRGDGTVWTWPSSDYSQSPAERVLTPRQIQGLTQVWPSPPAGCTSWR